MIVPSTMVMHYASSYTIIFIMVGNPMILDTQQTKITRMRLNTDVASIDNR